MVTKLIIKKSKRGIAMIELIFALVIMGIVLMSAPMLIQQSIKSGNVALQQEAIAAAASHTSMILSLHWDESNTKYQAGLSPMLLTTSNLGKNTGAAGGGAAGGGAAGAGGGDDDGDDGDDDGGTGGGHGGGHDGMFDSFCQLFPNLPLCQNLDEDEDEAEKEWLNTNRPGLVGVIGRSIVDSNNTLVLASESNALGEDANDTILDDVDDYNGRDVNLTIFHSETSSADVGDYVDVDLKIDTTVTYANDTVTLQQATNVNSDFEPASLQSTNIKFIKVNLTSGSGIAELDKNITMQAFSCNIGTTTPKDIGEKN